MTEPDAEDWGWYSELGVEGNNYLVSGADIILRKTTEVAQLGT